MHDLDKETIQKLVKKIVDNVGGLENINESSAQLTRLKLILLDPKKVNEQTLLENSEEYFIGILDKINTENALYLVMNKLTLAQELVIQINRLKANKS